MHIAFLTPEFPHSKTNNSGGLGTSINNLANALVKNNQIVTVIVYGQKTSEVFIQNGITIYLIEDKKYTFGKWFFYRKYIQKRVQTLISQKNIDCIEAPDWTGITAFMKFTKPLIIRFHGSDALFCKLEGRKQKLKNFWFEQLAINSADAFIAPTQFAGNETKKIFNIKKKEITVIHYGLELEKFHNQNPEIFTKGLVLYIGTIIRKKGVFELPDIFNKVRQQYPDAQLLLIGNDSADIQTGSSSTWKLVQDYFSKSDLENVKYVGKIPYADVQEQIKRANVCVFPTFAETLGMVTIESMAMQKAVVNSNFGWCKELIDDGVNGFLVDPKDHEQFANTIVELMQNDQLNSSIRSKALSKVQSTFSIDQTVKQNIAFYSKIGNL